jgi:hypothetical protein
MCVGRNPLIYEAIGCVQEGFHCIKSQKRPVSVIKIDLEKTYDRVSCLFLRLLLLQIGFDLCMVKWVMDCVTSVSFGILVNGVRYHFFNPK